MNPNDITAELEALFPVGFRAEARRDERRHLTDVRVSVLFTTVMTISDATLVAHFSPKTLLADVASHMRHDLRGALERAAEKLA